MMVQNVVKQNTIKKVVSITGVGMHTGEQITLTLRPAPANTGIIFRRTDRPEAGDIAATAQNIGETRLASTLVKGDVKISTIEHLMATLAGLGIDNLLVELNGPEVPILDGSAFGFAALIQVAGIKEQDAIRRVLRIKRKLEVRDGDSWIKLSPFDGFRMNFELTYRHSVIASAPNAEIDFAQQSFTYELSGARTFGFLADHEQLRTCGLARGAGLHNAVVIDEERGVLNEDGLRYPDECVRHKLLDALGDLYQLGHRIVGEFSACASGHTLNNRLNHELLAHPECWELVECVSELSEGAAKDDGVWLDDVFSMNDDACDLLEESILLGKWTIAAYLVLLSASMTVHTPTDSQQADSSTQAGVSSGVQAHRSLIGMLVALQDLMRHRSSKPLADADGASLLALLNAHMRNNCGLPDFLGLVREIFDAPAQQMFLKCTLQCGINLLAIAADQTDDMAATLIVKMVGNDKKLATNLLCTTVGEFQAPLAITLHKSEKYKFARVLLEQCERLKLTDCRELQAMMLQSGGRFILRKLQKEKVIDFVALRELIEVWKGQPEFGANLLVQMLGTGDLGTFLRMLEYCQQASTDWPQVLASMLGPAKFSSRASYVQSNLLSAVFYITRNTLQSAKRLDHNRISSLQAQKAMLQMQKRTELSMHQHDEIVGLTKRCAQLRTDYEQEMAGHTHADTPSERAKELDASYRYHLATLEQIKADIKQREQFYEEELAKIEEEYHAVLASSEQRLEKQAAHLREIFLECAKHCPGEAVDALLKRDMKGELLLTKMLSSTSPQLVRAVLSVCEILSQERLDRLFRQQVVTEMGKIRLLVTQALAPDAKAGAGTVRELAVACVKYAPLVIKEALQVDAEYGCDLIRCAMRAAESAAIEKLFAHCLELSGDHTVAQVLVKNGYQFFDECTNLKRVDLLIGIAQQYMRYYRARLASVMQKENSEHERNLLDLLRKLHGQQPEFSMSQLRNAGLTEFERDYGALIGSLDEQRQADVQVATQVNAQVTDNVGVAESVTESAAASGAVLGDDNELVDGRGDEVSEETEEEQQQTENCLRL